MNLGRKTSDNPKNVLENWRIFGLETGIPTSKIVCLQQVHGNRVEVVTADNLENIFEPMEKIQADGLVTNVPGVPLCVFTADCVPLLMYDPLGKVIAAVHCGWRPVAADIMENAVEKMRMLGATPEQIRAVTGPCIGICCFETGKEVPEALKKMLAGDDAGLWRYLPDKKKYMVDLAGVVMRRLGQLGIRPEHTEKSDECTMCRNDTFWSHRRDGFLRGSQASVIML